MTATTRRAFLRGAALAGGASAAGLSLSSCATPITAAGSESNLQYWNFFGGGDGERMIALVDTFRTERPEIDLTATTLAWGSPYYTKLAMAAAGGRPPDIATIHLSRLPTFAEHLLDPWDLDKLAELGIQEADFPAPLWEMATRDGELFAVPLDVHPLVTFANTDICAEAGLLDADGGLKPITSPEELLAAAKACAEVTGGIGIAYPAADGFVSWMLFWTLYRQLGGTFDLPPGGKVGVDEEKLLTVFRFLREFTDGEAVPTTLDAAGSIALFASGKAGLCFTGDWEVTTYLNSEIPFTMVPFPPVFGENRVRADGHALVLPQQIEVDQGRENAYLFAASLLKNSLGWAAGGHIPAYGPVADSDEYLAMQPQSNIREVADTVQFDPIAYFSGTGSNLMWEAGRILFSVHSGTVTPEQAVDQLVSWMQKQLDTPSPV
ncbi:multiple sugar transport system substrate-binding protein [Kineococcus xinjiangensis]|uniref:Multiple sugar transport system substrate-binding protein n=1 Tax=Kineococcus xinjiangensis TaxID=512762 RepID=A0A2S6IT70_9ACTN|nr:extracellular solute-binding protein [Kineococcus xinjiangensis]PPK97428.1 multiple sugar transport system substrate-binding protein [Kineococcus xinjiangensis]